MKIVGNLLCDPNYDYVHIEPGQEKDPDTAAEMWAMFAMMEHVGGVSRKFRIKANGRACRMMHVDRLKKGDFVQITGYPRVQNDGRPYGLVTEYRLLKKAVSK